MKNILNICLAGLVLLCCLSLSSCTQEYDDLVTANATTGGLLTVPDSDRSVNYIVGNTTDYSVDLLVNQGSNATTKVDVYKQFIAKDGSQSNQTLFKTINVTETAKSAYVSYSFSYADLIDGLTIDGGALPADDQELTIGDQWLLTYKTVLADGKVVSSSQSSGSTSVAVSTRFAGTYVVIASGYWRIGAVSGSGWNGSTRIVESVDAVTYKLNGYGPFVVGDFGYADQFLYFTVIDDQVTPLREFDGTAQTGNEQPTITCTSDPGNMTNAGCDDSNYTIKDDVLGKDRIILSYGYLSASGPREFYEVLEKIVK